jgi:hypothetical protein
VHRKRRDANHTEIVKQLRQCGVAVIDLGDVGNNCPDTVWGYRGYTGLLELKDSKTPISQGQKKFMATWPGAMGIARSFTEAMEHILNVVMKGGK